VRFVAFGLATVIAIGALTARVFQLQVAGGAVPILAQPNSSSLQRIASSRGVIYDRGGDVLVRNVPSFTVGIRPADLPLSRRTEVATRLSTLLGVDASAIISVLDASPGSRFNLVRVAQDVPRATADLISESGFDLPGVETVVESPRVSSFHWLVGTIPVASLGRSIPDGAPNPYWVAQWPSRSMPSFPASW
jgi:cell division protein FtsI/penicillin-binding protein 2